jgi:hypothetical protein
MGGTNENSYFSNHSKVYSQAPDRRTAERSSIADKSLAIDRGNPTDNSMSRPMLRNMFDTTTEQD